MTTIERAAPATPTRVGQGTAIEQSRAVAQVEAAVLVAQRYPRNQQAAIAAMRESCRFPQLAERAFYSYRRGGSNVTGSSVYLARELARIWGNIDYGVQELRRDDEHGQSEMQAVAWDVQTNTRVSQIFIVPHSRDKDGGTVPLTQNRDLYENNANAGARRVRAAIYAVLPPWFVAEAEELCRQTIENGGDVPLAQRIADVVRDFAQYFGVDEGRLEAQVGRPTTKWTAPDVANLRIIGRSIRNGEITADEAFPQARVTAAEVIGEPRAEPTSVPPAAPVRPVDDPPAPDPAPPAEEDVPQDPPARPAPKPDGSTLPATSAQVTKVHTLLSACRVTKREDRLDVLSVLTGQRLTSSNDLTRAEANTVLDLLERVCKDAEPAVALEYVVSEYRTAAADSEAGA